MSATLTSLFSHFRRHLIHEVIPKFLLGCETVRRHFDEDVIFWDGVTTKVEPFDVYTHEVIITCFDDVWFLEPIWSGSSTIEIIEPAIRSFECRRRFSHERTPCSIIKMSRFACLV